MPDVVADTSVIQYLFQIGLLDLLFTLYPKISIPQAVADELAEGRRHGVELPDDDAMTRFEVLSVDVPTFLQTVKSLGPGECQVLSLALANPGCLVLIDDVVGRKHARGFGVRFTGTLGILLKAKQSGLLVELRSILDKLEGKGFRLDKKTRAAVLELSGEREE
ncbi:MAG TPA: DUF3368 domain-containing protein [Pyrinomonadaceae bacterium]